MKKEICRPLVSLAGLRPLRWINAENKGQLRENNKNINKFRDNLRNPERTKSEREAS